MFRYAPKQRSEYQATARKGALRHRLRRNRRFRRLRHEQLEDRLLLTTAISIDDVSVIEGDTTPRFIDDFVAAGSGVVDYPTGIVFGPDANADGWDDAYVASALTDQVLRYDGRSGVLLDVFVSDAPATPSEDESGGLDFPNAMVFDTGGYLYVGSWHTDQVLRYDGNTGEFLGVFVGDDAATPDEDESGGLQSASSMLFGPDFDGNGSRDLYVASGATNQVLCYDGGNGSFLGVFVGDDPTTTDEDESGGLDNPVGMSFGPGTDAQGVEYLYLSSFNTGEVLLYDGENGAFVDVFIPAGSGGINGAGNFVFDLEGDDDLYMNSGGSAGVFRFDGTTGDFVERVATPGSGGLRNSWDLCFGPDGNLYVSGSQTDEILRYGHSSQAVFTVSLSSPSDEAISVDYATSDGTATAGDDYVAVSGTVVIAAGEANRSVIVPSLVNAEQEGDETFQITLSNPSGDVILDKFIGQAVIKDTPSVAGTVYEDADGNGSQDLGESGAVRAKVFLDLNRSGLWETGETRVWTSADGGYQFIGLNAGTQYNVLPESPLLTTPGSVAGPALWGTVEAGLAAAASPRGLAWANGHLYQLDRDSAVIYEIDPATGSVVSAFQGPAGDLWDITTSDGVTFWALNHANDDIVRFERDGVILDSISVPDSYLTGITSHDGSLWVLDRVAESVTQIDPATGLAGVSFAVTGSGGSLDGLAFDGHNFWANRWLDPWASSPSKLDRNRTYKFSPTGQELLSFVTPFARDHQAISLAYDGESLWIGQLQDQLLVKATIDTGGQLLVADANQVLSGINFGMVQPGSLSGVIFDDEDGDGVHGGSELGLERRGVYLDQNQNGVRELWEDAAFTDAEGNYSIDSLPPGNYVVTSTVPEPGWVPTIPASQVATIDVSGEALNGVDFGHRQTAFGPTGPDFLVNSSVDGSQQTAPDVAWPTQQVSADAAGNTLVVWQGNGLSDADGIFAQRFNSSGSPVGSEFCVNTTTAGVQKAPLVAVADVSGDAVVVWFSDGSILGQRYDAAGNAVGSEFAVLAATSKLSGVAHAVGMDEDGDFVVAYRHFETKGFTTTRKLLAQRFTSAGDPLGKAILVDNLTSINGGAGLGMDAAGNFVVVWDETEATHDVWAQRYSSAGRTIGSVIQVNPPHVDASELFPSVAMNSGGEFAVAWTSDVQQSAVVRLFDATGAAQSAPIEFGGAGHRGFTAISMQSNGEFVLAWNENPPNRQGDVVAQRFDATGAPKEDPFTVNTTIMGEQFSPSISSDSGGSLTIIWSGQGPGDAEGVFGQRYDSVTTDNIPPVAVSDDYSTAEDVELTVDAASGVLSNDTDPDGDALSTVLLSDTQNGNLTLYDDGSFVYTPSSNFDGSDDFTYWVFDGTNYSSSATVTLTVSPVNDGPAITSSPVAVAAEGTPYTYDVDADDPDAGDQLIYSLDVAPAGMTIDEGSGVIQWTPGAGEAGDYPVTVIVTDVGLLTDTQTYTLTVDEAAAVLVFSSSDGPLDILDRQSVFSSIEVSGIGATVGNLSLRIDLTHERSSDLTARLIHSQGFEVDIVEPILSGDYDHQYVISAATGQDLDGTWTLELRDNKKRKVGILREWDMTVELALSSLLSDGTVTPSVESRAVLGPHEAERAAITAIALWGQRGKLMSVSDLNIHIADLPDGQLAAAWGNTITLDVNADGYGWYMDLDSPAANGIDLLSVVSHELGHLLGYGHSLDTDHVMAATLPAGFRRLPSALPAAIPEESAPASPPLLLDTRLTASAPDLNDDTILASRLEEDFLTNIDTLFLPATKTANVNRPALRKEAAHRILNDISDELVELLDDDLLELISTRQP